MTAYYGCTEEVLGCIFCEEAGGEVLWEDDLCRAVWAYEADYPALCRVILDRHVKEMTELNVGERTQLMRVVFAVEQGLIQVQQGIDVGTFDDEDIVDPAREFALKRFSQMSATFDYNIALARLAQVTGWDAVAGEE